MRILAIDPGATTGWCVYLGDTKRVAARGQFEGFDINAVLPEAAAADAIVVESLRKAHANAYPTTVESAYICGRIVERLEVRGIVVHELLRIDIKRTLTDATLGEIRVKNDKTAWLALVMLHGGVGCDRKPRRKKGVVVDEGGPLGGVTGHERAALACAVAWLLRQEAPQPT